MERIVRGRSGSQKIHAAPKEDGIRAGQPGPHGPGRDVWGRIVPCPVSLWCDPDCVWDPPCPCWMDAAVVLPQRILLQQHGLFHGEFVLITAPECSSMRCGVTGANGSSTYSYGLLREQPYLTWSSCGLAAPLPVPSPGTSSSSSSGRALPLAFTPLHTAARYQTTAKCTH